MNGKKEIIFTTIVGILKQLYLFCDYQSVVANDIGIVIMENQN